jgi:Cu-processing system permease protein
VTVIPLAPRAQRIARCRHDAVVALAGTELRSAIRSRFVQGFGALFAALTVGVALAGLAASGQLVVQGFTRTAVSLLTLALYLLPLLGLVLGASAFGAEDGGTELLLVQPVGRGAVLAGRTIGLALALVGVAGAGFGTAGMVVVSFAGSDGLAGYLLVAAGATAVGVAALALGVLIGVLARRRLKGIGGALAAWLVLAVLFDFAAIIVLQLAGSGQPGPWLVGLLALDPIDGVRTLSLVALGADVLLGPTGAALGRALGAAGGAGLILGSLAVWGVTPLLLAVRIYRRRDF